MSKHKSIPKFKSLEEEDQFWQKNDSADFIDWTKAAVVGFPSLEPSTRSSLLRLPEDFFS